MARGRMISSSLGGSRKFSRLQTNEARLVYCLILPHADAYGRIEADADFVKGTMLSRVPIDADTLEAALEDLHRVELIHLYEVDGFRYAEIVGFDEHNRTDPSREGQTSIPNPDGIVPERPPRQDPGKPSQTRGKTKRNTSRASVKTKSRPTTDNVAKKKKVKENLEEETDKDLSAHADATPTIHTLIDIWNEQSGDLRKVRDTETATANPELQRLAKAFLKRHNGTALAVFQGGIPAVRTDPHWLGARASPRTRDGAPYGIVNYLRHVETKYDQALDIDEQPTDPTLDQYTERGL